MIKRLEVLRAARIIFGPLVFEEPVMHDDRTLGRIRKFYDGHEHVGVGLLQTLERGAQFVGGDERSLE